MRTARPLLAGVLILCAAAATAGAQTLSSLAESGRRVALVIGNDAYRDMPLRNAVNDARAVGAALQRVGFSVQTVTDTTYRDLGIGIDRFIAQLRPGDILMVYFAGHGIQIEGENYLLPVDFEAKDEADAKYMAYSAARLAERLAGSGARLNMLVLDACRNNPFRVTRSATRGLAAMNGGAGSLIAFATAPGSVAADSGSDATNGLFTSYLLEALEVDGLSIDDVFSKVREDVYRASGGRQLPYVTTSIIGKFYFRAPAPPTGAALAKQADAAETLWQTIKDMRSAELFDTYLQRYPGGVHAPEAARRRDELKARTMKGAGPAASTAVAVAPGLTFSDQARGADDSQIRDIIAQYRSAFASRDVGDVREIWPSADRNSLERLFFGARSIEVSMTCGPVAIRSATTAEVDCVTTMAIIRTRGDSPSAVPVQQKFYLVKRAARWVIDQVKS